MTETEWTPKFVWGLTALWLAVALLTAGLLAICRADPAAVGVMGGLAVICIVWLVFTAGWAAWELAWSRKAKR